MSAERRVHLAALADEYGFWIIEDDPYGELWFDTPAPAPVAAHSDRVIRLSSGSKTLAPALRIGWLHGDRRVCEAVELLKQGADLCGSSLTQQIATELLGDAAWLDGHLATVRAAYAGRAHALVSSLEAAFGERISHATVHGGMFCWIEFADATDTTRLLDTAVGHDVAFVPGGAFGVASAHPHAARLCFATYDGAVLDTVVLTNAAGGIREGMSVGQPVLISDHLNLTARSPLVGAQFVNLVDAYSPRLRTLAREIDPTLAEGVYAGLPGPHYETPAEIRMLRILGADLVGMSTVHETIAARALGAEVLGISLVTNLAAGITGEPLDHAEVLAAGQASAGRMGGLLRDLLARL
ncbi:aminotransferase class I/II-fold pyridoxal phosphate-dependent enzyme [Rhodococcus hoagii]|nr:aminotransferase class I/II-fold pyridoxal phosphate-dependent enzyme [Prescottella equi]